MSIKKIVTVISILVISVIILIIYPSTDKSVNAGQSTLTKEVPALANLYRISVSSNDVLVHYFGRDVVDKTMKQPGCVGVRMYYGKNANGKSGFVFVGVDKNGKDLQSVILAGPIDLCPTCPH
jgi:competence protein ComGC